VRAEQKRLCLHAGPTPEAIRRTANESGLPVNSITEVRALDPYFHFEEKEKMKMKCSMKRRLFVARATGPQRELKVRRLMAPPATAATLTLALVAMALVFSSAASAQSGPSCADPVTSAPTGPATVSAASTSYGRVLVVGSGDHAGCSLYLITSDELHALSGANFACSDNANVLGKPCDTVLWPALLTKGDPVAGPGVNPTLLGTVTRTDMLLPGVSSVQQVTYAGQPLYRFFLDETPGETEGANLDDPVTSPAGIWYLVEPLRGRPATGQAQLGLETAPVGGTGPDETVLATRMNNDFSVFPNASFPVYSLSRERGHESGEVRSHQRHDGRGHESVCQGRCAVYWPPVLTSKRPEAGPGVDQHALGIIVRPDRTHQVTYNGRPLYLFNNDAYIGPIPGAGTQSINGAGADTPWGVFNTIPPFP
jgi:predicted lipoprotein with Yx(FWY)xxD motif